MIFWYFLLFSRVSHPISRYRFWRTMDPVASLIEIYHYITWLKYLFPFIQGFADVVVKEG